jgi:hypothetical protein
MNTKVGGNFVSYNEDTKFHYLEFGHGRYGVGKAGLQNRKVWTRLILWKPSSLLKAPQGHKYNPLGTQGGVIDPSIH